MKLLVAYMYWVHVTLTAFSLRFIYFQETLTSKKFLTPPTSSVEQCHNADVCVYVPFLRESKACTILIPETEGGKPLRWELSHWEFHPM